MRKPPLEERAGIARTAADIQDASRFDPDHRQTVHQLVDHTALHHGRLVVCPGSAFEGPPHPPPVKGVQIHASTFFANSRGLATNGA